MMARMNLAALFVTILLPVAASLRFAPKYSVALIFPRQKNTATTNESHHHPQRSPFSSMGIQTRKFLVKSTMINASNVANDGPINDMGTFPLCSSQTKAAFEGKNVILTGASGGLGRAMAAQLIKCNVRTLILSGRNSETLEAVQEMCNKINNLTSSQQPSKIHIVKCDLSDADSVDTFATESLRLCQNEVDVLVNNGGISSRSSFVDTTTDVDELLMRVNFLSGAALTKRIVPSIVSNNGHYGGDGKIIWISSIQGLIGTPFRTSYAASKFAVQGYCEALRSELASSGVSVHVVSPGYIRTNLSLSAVCGDGSKYGKMDETTAKGADPDKVAVQIFDSVAKGRQDFVIAASPSAKIALWIKFFAPSLLRKLLVKRFKKDSASRQ